LDDGDRLISARAAKDGDEIMVVTRNGMSVCFPVEQLRVRSRTAGGVRAIRLKFGDRAISMDVVDPEGSLLAVSENGYGKLTRMDKFRRQARGGSGVIAFKVDEKTGPLAATLVVEGSEELVIATAKAQVHRTRLSEVGVQGRYARGVWVMRPANGDHITSLAILTPSVIEAQIPAALPKPAGKAGGKAQKTGKAEKTTQAQLTMDIEEAAAGAEDPEAEDDDLPEDEDEELDDNENDDNENDDNDEDDDDDDETEESED